MKQRLLVMNGQKIVQVEQAGDWINQKVERAGGLKPGIYNLFLASPANRSRSHEGLVFHVDEMNVYQQVGRGLVAHARDEFTKLPETGSAQRISYDSSGKVSLVDANPKLTRGRSR